MAKKDLETNISKTEGVITQKELKREESKKAPLVEKKIESKVQQDVLFECGWAPLGKSNIAFKHVYESVSHSYNLDLVNKIFTMPKDLTDKDKLRYRAALKANGFRDVTIAVKGISYDKAKGKYVYKVVHPDHAVKNLVNGSIGLVMIGDNGKPMYDDKGKTITKQVNIVNGIVTTEDELVYAALLKSGFNDLGKRRINND